MTKQAKTITVGELSTAVRKALQTVKLTPTSENGPWPYINPPFLIGIIYRGSVAEIKPVADEIVKEVSRQIGAPVSPVIEQEGAAGTDVARALGPGHTIMGYRYQGFVSF